MVDTLGDFEIALNRMLEELGVPPVESAAIERMVGRGSEHLIRSVLQHVGAAPALYERAWQSYQAPPRAAGCPVLLETYGYNHGQPVRDADADGFIDSLADLPQWLSLPCPTAPP